MSEQDPTMRPIDRANPEDAALARLLDGYKAPNLRADFADRVMAGTADRAASLPQARPSRGGRWRSARRLAIGAGAFGALATAAAATGLLDDLPIDLPSTEEVWATITGNPAPSAPKPNPAPEIDAAPILETDEPIVIEGPIDTPEELEEAFERIDRVREDRRDTRRGRVDNRIDEALERRREQGLPAPTAEQEERLKERLDQFRTRRDESANERIGDRREDMRERVEQGEELSPRDILREERGAAGGDRIRERIEELRSLPPAERRERLREFRERRQQRLDDQSTPPVSEPSPSDDPPETPQTEPPQK
ncbi:MAG: hypothetical protein AAF692_09220 [Pseudomonadota bacterium]